MAGRVFRHPVSWAVQLPQGGVGLPHFRQLFYVANIRVGAECVEVRANEFTCGSAIPPLEDDNIVIAWAEVVGMGAGLLGRQANLVVDGHEAALEIADDPGDLCEGADVAASLDILTGDHSNESVVYCSRGVGQEEALAGFRRFIGSIRLGGAGPG